MHTRYVFALMQNVQAVDGTNVTPTAPHIAFDGFGASMPAVAQQYGRNPAQNQPQPPQYGKNPAIAPAQTGYVGRPNAPPEDATNLELTPMRLNDGRYNVIARWMGSADTKRTLDSYLLFTGQNGNAYAFDSAVAKDLTSVQYSRVSPGTFAVKVAARDASGNQSQGIDRVITLPASGLGLFGILAASGAAAGQRLRRKREDEQC